MKRLGAVIVFKEGVTALEAADALRSIKAVLDTPETTIHTERVAPTNFVRDVRKPFRCTDLIREFDDQYGEGPVWYIP